MNTQDNTRKAAVLHSRTAADLTLQAALAAGSGVLQGPRGKLEVHALLYSPRWCRFAKVVGDSLCGENGDALSVEEVFEARIFSRIGELRWLHRSQGMGDAALISEEALTGVGGAFVPMEKLELYGDPLDNSYLIWGQGDPASVQPKGAGWGQVSEQRIGPLLVPCKVAEKQRLLLNTREYAGVVDDNGNVAVIEERLVGFEAINTASADSDDLSSKEGQNDA